MAQVRLWVVPSEPSVPVRPYLVLSGHTDVIRCVAFSPVASSRLLASSSEDRTVRIWWAEATGARTRVHLCARSHTRGATAHVACVRLLRRLAAR